MSQCQTENSFEPSALSYPDTFRDSSVVEDYHGESVSDPYRWLEDDNSDETIDWVTRQNETTFSFLDQIPFRQNVNERLSELWDYERYSSPFKENGDYYYFKNDGLQNQSVLYRQVADAPDEVVLDPNTFSDDGTSSLAGLAFSKNAKYLGYLISDGGSDWRRARVLDLTTGEHLEDDLRWIKFSGVSWDGDGFFYSRYPASDSGDELIQKNEFHSLYYHRLGTEQSEDDLVYVDRENPQRNVFGQTTEDERYLVAARSESTSGNAIMVKDLSKPNSSWVELVTDFDNDFNFIDNEGSRLMFLTNRDAPNQRLTVFDLNNPSAGWTDLIAEDEDVLQGAAIAGGKIFCEYLHNASSLVKVFDMGGDFIQDLELPSIGNIGSISSKKEDTEAFFSFSSYTVPTTIYSLNTESLQYEVFKSPEIDFEFSDYVTEQRWYTSYDGTRVPMFVTHHKDLKLDGDNPTLLYGYGGFNISLLPGFSVTMLPILENGGVYAVANLRGGGEFGKEWHLAGTKDQKQNVFDDFLSAAEHLIEAGYTSPEKLAIRGGSNGGLLVGAAMTQRPDLFKVAFPAVGVMDMLRYHKFTIGWAWATDYGSSDNPEDFEYLVKYSPLHNLNAADYPATMVTTADHDDRVVPAHSFKFAAELQHQHTGNNPVVIRVETSAGHGAGKPTSKIIDEYADILSFMYYNMGENMSFTVKG